MNYYTYDVEYNQKVDIGAQYHRMISIYCLVKYLDSNLSTSNTITYVHNPISPDPSGIDQYFGLSRFLPGKYGIPTEFNDVKTENRPTFEELQVFYQTETNKNKRVILEIGFPEDVMKNHPEIYTPTVLKELQGYVNTATSPATPAFTTKTNIVVHIVDLTNQAYYLALIDILNKIYGLDDSNICIIALEAKKGELDPYREKKNTTVLPNLDFLPMFQYMSTCDVLFMSPTSMSYLAALYNSVAKDIYYMDCIYKKLDEWKNSTTITKSNTGSVIPEEQEGFASYSNGEDAETISYWIAFFMLLITVFVILYFVVINGYYSFSWSGLCKSMFRIVRR
jgi:hypothetical protein